MYGEDDVSRSPKPVFESLFLRSFFHGRRGRALGRWFRFWAADDVQFGPGRLRQIKLLVGQMRIDIHFDDRDDYSIFISRAVDVDDLRKRDIVEIMPIAVPGVGEDIAGSVEDQL